jgi:uridine phosphorylase
VTPGDHAATAAAPAPVATPLHEFDPSPIAVIDPSRFRGRMAVPERAVLCWFGDVVQARTAGLQPVFNVDFEHGVHPMFIIEHLGEPILLFNPGVGAPLAVNCLEVAIALGATKLIGCGGAGIVVPHFDVGHVIVPTGAIRDEGTSYHYAPAGVEVLPHPDAVAAIDAELTAGGVPHDRGLTWTTDAIFRETPARVARRRQQGCLTVEMEASAMFAVATFRGATYGQLLYAGDDVSAEEWDHRHWDRQDSARERLLDLALGAVLRL